MLLAGDYTVAIKWDDVHIPDSPFGVLVSGSAAEAKKLQLESFPRFGLQVNIIMQLAMVSNGCKRSSA